MTFGPDGRWLASELGHVHPIVEPESVAAESTKATDRAVEFSPVADG
jgi:hypothetical protein